MMPEKWRPTPSVLNGRRVRMRGFLTRGIRPSYIPGEPVERGFKDPPMDAIWEWNKGAVEDIPHLS